MKAIRGKKLTSREAARALGVSEASVKRWADSGLLAAEKTAGGHRRFRPEDVAAVLRAGVRETEPRAAGKLVATSAATSAPAAEVKLGPAREAALAEEAFDALTGGRVEDLSALVVSLHLHGRTVGAIADRFLCPAMRRVGDLWHSGEMTVAQEHVATRTASDALDALGDAAARAGDRRPLALCCSVEEDFHALPVRLAAVTLEAAGFEVFDVGLSTPFFALTETLERFRPRLVCVSSTLLGGLDRAAREYADFRRAARRRGAAVVLGGAGFAGGGVRQRFPADLHADSFRQLEEFAASVDAVDAGES
ncbi:MAG TPA: B12-binding domain-containing protein [Pyrinomonadaceae bacterium]|nr:B12-binding domain-containing protein [Pyrinomonadaceae bacterium]